MTANATSSGTIAPLHNTAQPGELNASSATGGVILVDGHVHIHSFFEIAKFLDSAAVNFRRAAKQLGVPPTAPGCLLLTESYGVDRFAELRKRVSDGFGRWILRPTDEDCSLVARTCDGESTMILIAGRQIVVRERLEVLALACRQHFEDGQPMRDVIGRVLASNALCVVPWGFGKWSGRRGVVVRGLLDSGFADRIFLGDNGGRLRLGPRPKLFKAAGTRGVRILPGTDPLPLAHQVTKAGRYGFVLPGLLDDRAPAGCIKALLRQGAAQPRVFGKLESLPRFVRCQIAMQLQKRRDKVSR